MLIGLATYLYAPAAAAAGPADCAAREQNAARPRRAGAPIVALLILFVPVSLFWATYEQQGNTIALWADENTDRTIDLLFWRGEIPTTWFQAFNPFMIFAFTPFVVALWARQARRGTEPSTAHQDGARLLRLPRRPTGSWPPPPSMPAPDKASWLWLFAYFVVITMGELYISPIGLSLVSKVAPAGHLAMMMGVWLATSFTGNFLAGYLGSFWSSMDKPAFFVMIAAIAVVAGVAIWAFDRPLRAALRH